MCAHITYVDVSGDPCPMSWLRTKLALDVLPTKRRLLVRVRDRESVDNILASIEDIGGFSARVRANFGEKAVVEIERRLGA